MADISTTPLPTLIHRRDQWKAVIGTRSTFADAAPKIVAELTFEISKRAPDMEPS